MQLAGHRRMITGALTIAAIAAPIASARPNIEPQPPRVDPSTGHVTAVAGAEAKTRVPRPQVRPNPDSQATLTSQVGPPILRSAPATEASKRTEAHAARRFAYTPDPSGRYSSAGLGVHASVMTDGARAAVPAGTHGSSFDWGDAAIGAGGGLAVSLLVIGGTFQVVRRRQPEARPQKALVG
jgi:hypothetical protein